SPSKQGLSLTAFAANAAKTWGAALLANNADKLMAYGTSLIHNLFAKKKKNEDDEQQNIRAKTEVFNNN
ncbi:MAG TPA: hypothetical protein PLU18_10960, partial [Ferruginibacter sp.]|nr:hypothetical protein [Ferruginibacter sp.]